MTNEELAKQIQGGNKQLIPDLWDSVSRLMFKLSYAYYNKNLGRCTFSGVTLEDLQQESFCAFMSAVKSFNPDKGFKFTTYIKNHVANHFNALTGVRGHKDPINEAISLDAPLTVENESITLCDTLADQNAADNYDDIEKQIYHRELHEAMEKSLNTLDEQQRLVIREYWYKDKTYSAIGTEMGKTRDAVRCIEAKAMRDLRKPRSAKYLKSFADDIVRTLSCSGTGLTAFKYNGASIEERIIERLEFQPADYK